jgi:type I restriction enzyme S subunit
MTWELTRLSELLTERTGRIKHQEAVKLGLQRVKKIDFAGNIHLDVETDTKTDMILVKNGDLLVSGINAAKGAIGVYSGTDDVLATIHYSSYMFHPDKMSVEFLQWFFKSEVFTDLLERQTAGGIKTELKPKHILPLQVNIPPLSEQHVLAKRLNHIRSDQLQLEQEFINQQSLLATLKRAVLQEATSGVLTSSWRAIQPGFEPASQLLIRLKAERARQMSGKKQNLEGAVLKDVPGLLPFQIPESWEWCRLGEIIAEKPRNGVSLKPVDYVTSAKTLKLTAISSGVFDGSHTKYLDLDVAKDSYLWLREGDILVQRANSLELVGTSAVYRGADCEFIYPDLIMKLRAVLPESTDYIHLVLSADFTREYFRSSATGSAGNMPKINQETVMNALIPMPPIAEQVVIADRVRELFAAYRALEAANILARAQSVGLLQAALSEAFAPANLNVVAAV